MVDQPVTESVTGCFLRVRRRRLTAHPSSQSHSSMGHEIYLEVGAKRVFAGAIDWPGWCRHGPDESSALGALVDHAPRYAAVVRPDRFGFSVPARTSELRVVERLVGNATTDFGALGVIPSADRAPVAVGDGARFERLIRAGWRGFDAARKRAEGKVLQKGPRGGGRNLESIVRHVVDADAGHLAAIGWKQPGRAAASLDDTRAAVLAALGAALRGELPARGPRGGTRWPVRFFVRRVVWHALAHAWEIERRLAVS